MKKVCLIFSLVYSLFSSDDLRFNTKYSIKTIEFEGKAYKVKAYENIPYVKNIIDKDYQSFNFYILDSISKNDADKAPIFLPNFIGGYKSAKISYIDDKSPFTQASLMALSKGYAVVLAGFRGANNFKNDEYFGKAPASIVDLKALVRYLHYNDDLMLGDANKIISNGTSAGGAMSLLLGLSQGSRDYDEYLEKLGAAKADDSIYAISSYCPITNLENADMAYEWQFNGRYDYKTLKRSDMVDFRKKREFELGKLNEDEIKISQRLAKDFVSYLNSLNLVYNKEKLSLNDDLNGSFKEFLTKNLGANFDALTRSKITLAFDKANLSSAENELFGDNKTKAKHFSKNYQSTADKKLIKIMNVMNYVNNDKAAKFVRIRHGKLDSDTSFAISAIVALKLIENGFDVDYKLVDGMEHRGDYDLDELFAWIDNVLKK